MSVHPSQQNTQASAQPLLRVLVIEDNDEDYRAIAEALHDRIHNAIISRISSEHEFDLRLRRIMEETPHLIVLDIVLRWQHTRGDEWSVSGSPGPSHRAGARIWQRLRQNESTSAVPTIVCSYLDADLFRSELSVSSNLYLAPKKIAGDIADLAARILSSRGDIAAPRPRRLFVSYASDDRQMMFRIRNLLKPMVHENHIEIWDDTQIPEGDWNTQVFSAMRAADAALFLVSEKSMASDFIYKKELPYFVRRYDEEHTPMFWIKLRPAVLALSALARFQCLHNPDIAIEHLPDHEQQTLLVHVAVKLAIGLGLLPPEPL